MKLLKTIKIIKNLIFSKPYGIGDELPKGLKLSNLDNHKVYKAKQTIKLINYFTKKELVKKL